MGFKIIASMSPAEFHKSLPTDSKLIGCDKHSQDGDHINLHLSNRKESRLKKGIPIRPTYQSEEHRRVCVCSSVGQQATFPIAVT